MNKEQISAFFQTLQDNICQQLEEIDGSGKFREDKWQRKEGGGGKTRIFAHGNLIEKGGVNYSAVFGKTPEKILTALQLAPSDFYATGISIVLHPLNPWVPIIHMNLRYFEMSEGTKWFGGGIDLTPHYIDKVASRHFHQDLKQICDRHHPSYYPKFKEWADHYFFIKHRDETRGIGGIFFDRLSAQSHSEKEQIFAFIKDVGLNFVPIYQKQVSDKRFSEFGEKEKQWQYIRRGRYVEFNLVWDKGTKFGLDTDGRTESILMSLPPQAQWEYDFTPALNSVEAHTLRYLRKGIDWINV
ncbi:MAG: oxygen-dependent coproporphyrinogen oxidase [Candidatus Cyclobacteriaceae bacterium M3_2C_046]